jgi:hypothetical protein
MWMPTYYEALLLLLLLYEHVLSVVGTIDEHITTYYAFALIEKGEKVVK